MPNSDVNNAQHLIVVGGIDTSAPVDATTLSLLQSNESVHLYFLKSHLWISEYFWHQCFGQRHWKGRYLQKQRRNLYVVQRVALRLYIVPLYRQFEHLLQLS